MNLQTLCPFCKNTGTWDNSDAGPTPCGFCSGSGVLNYSGFRLPDNRVWTFQILEATDSTEYSNLSAANKATYGLIISAGVVDISPGTKVRSKLLAMFGAGSTTRANLALLEA